MPLTDADARTLLAIDPAERDLAPQTNAAALEFLLTRRSTPAKMLSAPGPSGAVMDLILKAALRAPDHGKLTPWRLILIEGDARQRLADAAQRRAEAAGREDAEKIGRGFLDGALIVAVIGSPKPSEKIPPHEQHASAAVVCATMVAAALAAGFGANWLTGWASDDALFRAEALGLSPEERVAGFIHMGTPRHAPPERPRPDPAALMSRL